VRLGYHIDRSNFLCIPIEYADGSANCVYCAFPSYWTPYESPHFAHWPANSLTDRATHIRPNRLGTFGNALIDAFEPSLESTIKRAKRPAIYSPYSASNLTAFK